MIMAHASQDRDVPTHEDHRNDEFIDWIEPLGSSADEMQKAYAEICGWLNQVSRSAARATPNS
jgi:hypothetical protein